MTPEEIVLAMQLFNKVALMPIEELPECLVHKDGLIRILALERMRHLKWKQEQGEETTECNG